ncbi:Peptidoglycan/xylan/chitin deacetylase, PgdA/CDA1 family [Mesobacillus persicus]|uniref:Peptidoglycan/xylan/chitin deacetylase, PgdA/CDA1 family n=1 Tax=Mesobacillus persicus TaxID=930146 RepID=A0A1H8CG34_9BACI|nr:polysaccharide deacetylase family protein [Mesobacillus persicus]SEM94005.1 Peptidoglycan/xylan/chitin deacetylase, PgdA/CDA1 family [Mesobacillus persicus]
MRRVLFNLLFSTGFVFIFSFLIYSFSDTLVHAFLPGSSIFPKDQTISLSKCQDWTQEVRDFQLEPGEEANRITVLMYHKIIDDQQIQDIHYNDDQVLQETIVLKSEFENQMAVLKKHDYVTLTKAEFQLFLENKLDIPKNSVLITFDDGFKNNYHEAYPILKKHNFTALNFVITSHVTPEESKYDPIGQQYFSIADMKKSCDVFDFESHSYNFHKRDEDGEAYLIAKNKESIKQDIAVSLINLNSEVPLFSYPYGEYDNETIEAIRDLNIKAAFTVLYDDVRPGVDLYEIPRKTVFPDDTIEDFKEKINLK